MESVPNFSEGKDRAVIQSITDAASSVAGARVLDLHSDPDHNRSVLTVAGEPTALLEAIYRAVVAATDAIDLRHHTGAHPRLGATDVVPFVPLREVTMQDAVAAAHSLGRRVAENLTIPVYFYESAASRPERNNLEWVRRKGFEQLRDEIETNEDRIPDIGPRRIHPSAGAIVIGARQPLIAYNIHLDTDDVHVARLIARRVRHSSGGLRYVKAIGLATPAQRSVQVSMNLTNFHGTALHTVFELVRIEAEAMGVRVTHSEIVGLAPMEAIAEVARHYLRLRPFDVQTMLEARVLDE